MTETIADMRMISGLSQIIADYDAILCDVWGVFHNGIRVSEAAQRALTKARRDHGKVVCLFTNAPREAETVASGIRNLGGSDVAWDEIVSSGALTMYELEERDGPFHYIGPPKDSEQYARHGFVSGPFETARFVLCAGLEDESPGAGIEEYVPLLEEMLARHLPLICANPDLTVGYGDVFLPCAGLLATRYEEMGGDTTWIGKPYPLMYETAREKCATKLGHDVSKSRLLAIGDSFRTDIRGAANYGIDSLLVRNGINDLSSVFSANDPTPTYHIDFLKW